jgi:hypothetical protein
MDAIFIYCTGYIGDDTKPYFTLYGIDDSEFGSYAQVYIKGRVYVNRAGTPKYIKGTISGDIPGNPPDTQHRCFAGSFRLPWHIYD